MRRTLRVLRFVALAVATGLCTAAPGRAAESIGSVALVQESAFRTVPGEGREAVEERADVYSQELLETLERAAVQLRFVDETDFRMGENSQVVLDSFVWAGGA